jgi:hypothetical protein
MKNKEIPVGGIGIIDGITVECVIGDNYCNAECHFWSKHCRDGMMCCADERTDRHGVWYKLVN